MQALTGPATPTPVPPRTPSPRSRPPGRSRSRSAPRSSGWPRSGSASTVTPKGPSRRALAYWCEGKEYYYTWWEMFPAGTVEVGATLRPGDLIHASVTRTGTSYTLAVTDYNDPSDSFSTSHTCTVCTNTSAEWIAERPEFPIGITPLTYFSDWGVSRASQTSDSVTGSIAAGPDA